MRGHPFLTKPCHTISSIRNPANSVIKLPLNLLLLVFDDVIVPIATTAGSYLDMSMVRSPPSTDLFGEETCALVHVLDTVSTSGVSLVALFSFPSDPIPDP